MNDTPIYTAALREAKRRTRKDSPERRELALMDARTEPAPEPKFNRGGLLAPGTRVVYFGPGDTPGELAAKIEADRR